MPATFLFSFDCEGKWGVADNLTPAVHEGLTDTRLKRAYHDILELLDEFAIPATFAFVGLFAERPERFSQLEKRLNQLARHSPGYLTPALADLRHGSGQGWHGHWAAEMVESRRTAHEIAFHGVTHIPWDQMSDELAAEERTLFHELESPVRQSLTMVFPRNRCARLDAAEEIGMIGYRESIDRPRLGNLLDEFNPLSGLQFGRRDAGALVRIPGGYFVNWQHGPRRLVPRWVSRLRARRIIERAADQDAVVHFWLHPENIAQAPATLSRLEDILRLVRRACDERRGTVVTQLTYCRQQRRPVPAARETVSLA